MQIPLFAAFGPGGDRQYLHSILSKDDADSLLSTAISAVANKLLDQPNSPSLGLVHRSSGVQVYAFVSCTGWVLILGLDHGPFDPAEVAASFFERVSAAVVDCVCNPFFTGLGNSRHFAQQMSSALQSHSVMMTFMASSQVLG